MISWLRTRHPITRHPMLRQSERRPGASSAGSNVQSPVTVTGPVKATLRAPCRPALTGPVVAVFAPVGFRSLPGSDPSPAEEGSSS